MFASDAGRAASRELRRVGWLLHAHVVETKFQALREAVKTNFDPNQPRIPAGHGRESGRWTDAGGGGGTGGRLPSGSDTLLDPADNSSERIRLAQNDPPDRESDVPPLPHIPDEKPISARLRNAIVKQVAKHVARLALEDLLGGPAGLVLNTLEIASWVYEFAPYIVAYATGQRASECSDRRPPIQKEDMIFIISWRKHLPSKTAFRAQKSTQMTISYASRL